MKKILALVIFFFLCLGCKKDEIPDKSQALELLQHKWTPTLTRLYFPNGENFKLIPFISRTFTTNGKVKVEYYTTTSTAIIIKEETVAKYCLLPDDSTLLFYSINDGIQSVQADTSYIASLTDSLLVYYSIDNNFRYCLDSLKRQ
ncbi:MAG: hypothetical protein AB7S48_00495 [Bacteroidales bacterium]